MFQLSAGRLTRTGQLRLFGHFGVRYPKENARCRDRPKSELDDPKAILVVFPQDFDYWHGLKTFLFGLYQVC